MPKSVQFHKWHWKPSVAKGLTVFCARVCVCVFCVIWEQKYIATVTKSVKSTEAQRTADAAKTKKVAAKEVRACVKY